ncbi:MAG: TonB-dependent receptor [Sphingobacteriales bacterium]|nr:MAG: TonB-dependent receptor [Sphingobacteriales bacterium]
MRIRSLYILLVVLLCTSVDATAQRKKAKQPPARQKKTAVAKKKASPAAAKAKQKPNAKETIIVRDTVIKGATIEIIQSYKPEIRSTPKPELTANLPPVDTSVPAMNYVVPQQTLSYNYTSFPLRPLALGTDSINTPFANYVKIGGGNLSTLLLDAGIGSLRGDGYESNIQLRHLSQSGDITNQKSSLTNLDADGTLHSNGNAWHAALGVLRNQYNYYGYDHSIYDPVRDSVKQAFTGVSLQLDMKNELQMIDGLDYHPTVGLQLYGDRFDASERSVNFSVPVTYTIDTNLQVALGINGNFTQFVNASVSQGNNVFQLAPALLFRQNGLQAHIGINPTLGKGNSYLLPDITASYNVPNSQFAIHAGWQANLRQNTYQSLSTLNPYMLNAYTLSQTRADEVYVGLQTNVGQHLTINGRVSWWQYNYLPLFVNDTLTDSKQFNVLYDSKVNAISVQAAARYQVANTFALGLAGTWFNFYSHTFDEVWHEPAIKLKADLMVKPTPALTITAYLSVMDQIYALTQSGQADKLNAIVDLGAGAEYQLIPRLSLFLQVNNLLNSKNERWLGYQAYGLNVFGGLRFKF